MAASQRVAEIKVVQTKLGSSLQVEVESKKSDEGKELFDHRKTEGFLFEEVGCLTNHATKVIITFPVSCNCREKEHYTN